MLFHHRLFVLVALALTSVTVAEDVTKLIPADAYGYVVIQRLGETDDALQALAQRAKLPLPSLVSTLGTKAGLVDGIDVHGSVAVVFLPTKDGPSAVLYVPIDDYAAFVKQLQVQNPEQTISEGTLLGKSVIVGRHDNYAAISWPSNRGLLESRLGGESEPTAWGKLDEQHQVAAAISPAGVSLLVDLGLEGLAKTKEVMRKGFGDNNPMVAGIEVYEHLLSAIRSEVASVRIGLELEKSGTLRFHKLVSVAPTGKFLPLLRELPDQEIDLLNRLPDIPFVLACGGEIPPGAAKSMIEFSGDMMKSMQQLYGLSPEQVDKLTELSVEQMPQFQGMAFMIGVGQGESPLYDQMLATFRVQNADVYMAEYRTYWEKFRSVIGTSDSPLFKDLKLEEVKINGRNAFKMTMSIKAFATFQVPGQNLDSIMEKLYGPDGLNVYVAAADQNTILLGYTDTRLLERAMQSTSSSTDHLPLDAQVNHTAKLLPSDGKMIGYLDLSGSLAFANRAIRVISGNALLLPEFPSAPPVGWTMTVEDDLLHFQSVVPAETLDALGTYVESVKKREAKADVKKR